MFNDHAFLYVDDESLSREVMRLVMEEALMVQHLTILEDSADFTQRIEMLDPQPDIILLDIKVKPLDGFEMLKHLRAHPDYGKATVIAVTAGVMSQEVNRLRAAGFDGAVAKPVRISTFPEIMQRIVQGEPVWLMEA
jgi:CheY-like chemotaxis protein